MSGRDVRPYRVRQSGFENDIEAVDKPWKRALIANALLDNHLRGGMPIEQLNYFFKGMFISNEIAWFENRKFPDFFGHMKKPKTPSPPPTPSVDDGPLSIDSSYGTPNPFIVWQRYLLSSFLGWAGFRYPFHPDRFRIVVEQFLKHGAPSDFHATIDNPESLGSVINSFNEADKPWSVAMGKTIETNFQNYAGGVSVVGSSTCPFGIGLRVSILRTRNVS